MLLDRRITSSAFIMHELEEECRERNLQWSFKGAKGDAIDVLMDKIEKLRSSELYIHKEEDCSELCRKRGDAFICITMSITMTRLFCLNAIKIYSSLGGQRMMQVTSF
jgi:hypothetical protein